MSETRKLYRVVLRGFGGCIGVDMKNSYVVATNPNEAYEEVRKWLDDNDYGFSSQRELESVHLIAEECEYTHVGTRLFI